MLFRVHCKNGFGTFEGVVIGTFETVSERSRGWSSGCSRRFRNVRGGNRRDVRGVITDRTRAVPWLAGGIAEHKTHIAGLKELNR